MAKLTFVLDGSDEFARRELGALLREDGEPLSEHRDMTIEFSDVPEDLARWMLSSMSALHGLSPNVVEGDVQSEEEAASRPKYRSKPQRAPTPTPAPEPAPADSKPASSVDKDKDKSKSAA